MKDDSTSSTGQVAGVTRDRRRRRGRDEPASPESVTAGKSAKYIDKVMSDERTNTLIVLANDAGHEAVRKLVAELDQDATDAGRSKIHVVHLEHAKAEQVTQVLESLANGGSRNSSSRNGRCQVEYLGSIEPAVLGEQQPNQGRNGTSTKKVVGVRWQR